MCRCALGKPRMPRPHTTMTRRARRPHRRLHASSQAHRSPHLGRADEKSEAGYGLDPQPHRLLIAHLTAAASTISPALDSPIDGRTVDPASIRRGRRRVANATRGAPPHSASRLPPPRPRAIAMREDSDGLHKLLLLHFPAVLTCDVMEDGQHLGLGNALERRVLDGSLPCLGVTGHSHPRARTHPCNTNQTRAQVQVGAL